MQYGMGLMTADPGSRNGVYFYRVTPSGGDPSWGKIMVLQ